MLALMRSFEVDADIERDLLNVRQRTNGDGSFLSVDHGLKIQLDDTWKPVEYQSMLLDNTAFVLEKEEGRCLIQLLHVEPYQDEDAQGLLKWYMENYQQGFDEDKVYTVEIEALGVTAYVADTEANIYLKNAAFVYQNRCYLGSFMWIKPYDEQMRPFMAEALQSLAPGFGLE